jgi:hypothetical protein
VQGASQATDGREFPEGDLQIGKRYNEKARMDDFFRQIIEAKVDISVDERYFFAIGFNLARSSHVYETGLSLDICCSFISGWLCGKAHAIN